MSKEAILGAIRRGLKRGPLPGDQAAMLRERMAHPPRHLVPARSQVPRPDQVALLVRNIEKEFGTVTRVPGGDEVPEAVAEYLAGQNLPSSLVMAPHPELRALPWSARPLLLIREGRAEGTDLVSLQHGFAGIAETGTLMLPSAPERPTTLNLLADTAVVVLRASRVVGGVRGRLGPAARRAARCRDRRLHAAQRHARHRPVPLRRHRADAGAWRARPAPPPCRADRGRSGCPRRLMPQVTPRSRRQGLSEQDRATWALYVRHVLPMAGVAVPDAPAEPAWAAAGFASHAARVPADRAAADPGDDRASPARRR